MEKKRLTLINRSTYLRRLAFFMSVILSLGIISPAVSGGTPVIPSPASTPPELDKNDGYLLLNFDVGGTAPSIEFSKLSTRGKTFLDSNQSVSFSRNTSYTISLKNKPNGFYLISLSPGLYQITKVNAPYFDLPFRLDTENRRIWRFRIEPQKTSYAGKLYINKERSADSIDVKLINRLAMDLIEIQSVLEPILSDYPLISGAGVMDEFLMEWSREKEVVK